MKAKRTIYLVTDYGGEWEDKWDSPYMAFDNEYDAEVCAEKRCKRNRYDGKEWPETFWDEYSFSNVVPISVLMDVPTEQTCQNVYGESECGACANGFECSACGCRVEDCEGYYVKGTWNFCPKCRRKVVEGGR